MSAQLAKSRYGSAAGPKEVGQLGELHAMDEGGIF